MARLIDMDDCEKLAASAQAAERDEEDEPLRYRTVSSFVYRLSCVCSQPPNGTPKPIDHRSPVARGRLLSDFAVVPKPILKSDVSGKYQCAYHCGDTSEVRPLSDSNETC